MAPFDEPRVIHLQEGLDQFLGPGQATQVPDQLTGLAAQASWGGRVGMVSGLEGFAVGGHQLAGVLLRCRGHPGCGPLRAPYGRRRFPVACLGRLPALGQFGCRQLALGLLLVPALERLGNPGQDRYQPVPIFPFVDVQGRPPLLSPHTGRLALVAALDGLRTGPVEFRPI